MTRNFSKFLLTFILSIVRIHAMQNDNANVQVNWQVQWHGNETAVVGGLAGVELLRNHLKVGEDFFQLIPILNVFNLAYWLSSNTPPKTEQWVQEQGKRFGIDNKITKVLVSNYSSLPDVFSNQHISVMVFPDFSANGYIVLLSDAFHEELCSVLAESTPTINQTKKLEALSLLIGREAIIIKNNYFNIQKLFKDTFIECALLANLFVYGINAGRNSVPGRMISISTLLALLYHSKTRNDKFHKKIDISLLKHTSVNDDSCLALSENLEQDWKNHVVRDRYYLNAACNICYWFRENSNLSFKDWIKQNTIASRLHSWLASYSKGSPLDRVALIEKYRTYLKKHGKK